MKRLFTAIKIHPDDTLTQLFNNLKTAFKSEKIKWVDMNNIHITLKFFGETEDETIGDITNELKKIASFTHSFELSLSKTGVFGSRYNPRVLWVGIEENKSLIRLGQEIVDEMDRIGFKKDRQNFVPHLTLGRIKYIDNKDYFFNNIQKYRDVALGQENIDRFYLYESKLFRTGPQYNVIETFTLLK